VMAGALFWAMGDAQAWLAMPALNKVAHLTVLVAVGAGAYFIALFALGVRFKDFIKRGAE